MSMDDEYRFMTATPAEQQKMFEEETREFSENLASMTGVFLSKLDEKGTVIALELARQMRGGAPELRVEKTSSREVKRFIKHVNKELRLKRGAILTPMHPIRLIGKLKEHWVKHYDDADPALVLHELSQGSGEPSAASSAILTQR